MCDVGKQLSHWTSRIRLDMQLHWHEVQEGGIDLGGKCSVPLAQLCQSMFTIRIKEKSMEQGLLVVQLIDQSMNLPSTPLHRAYFYTGLSNQNSISLFTSHLALCAQSIKQRDQNTVHYMQPGEPLILLRVIDVFTTGYPDKEVSSRISFMHQLTILTPK